MFNQKEHLQKDISGLFTSELLSEQKLAMVFGGKRWKPKSRDKDILDLEEDA